jgi:hypothetical protein
LVGTPYATMYFYGNTNSSGVWSDLSMSGSTNISMPSGQYYFDHGRFLASGSTRITGSNVFFYFKNKGYLQSSGSTSFGFTAPTTQIYSGYYPGVFIYGDRADTSTFTWTGSTSSASDGIVYVPGSQLVMTGSSSSKMLTGQIIANSFNLSGSNNTTVDYKQYVATAMPKAYLVQ